MMQTYKFSGSITDATDLRTLNSGLVSVVSGRDRVRREALVAAGHSLATTYAQIGLLLGKLASILTSENVGRAGIPPNYLPDNLPVTESELSGGQAISSLTDSELDLLYSKGYIYIQNIPEIGNIWVDDATCTDANRSDAYISLNRVIHKAAQIGRETLLPYLKATNLLNPDGTLSAITIADYENIAQNAIINNMRNPQIEEYQREISSATVTINANQNLFEGALKINVSVVPKGTNRNIDMNFELNVGG